jgi:hypothetical protein
MFQFAKPDSSVFGRCTEQQYVLLNRVQQNRMVQFLKSGGSRISRIVDESSKTMTVDLDDWRAPLVHYLENLSHIADRKVQWQALKYVMLDNTLYRRTIDGLLLK